MTRSSKALNPKAIAHDRSISRNGRDASLKKGGHLGWGVSSGQHLSHHPEDWDFEPLDDDHEPATDATVAKARVPVGEDEKVDKQWLRVLDLSLEMAAKMINEQEKQEALAVRKACLKNTAVDLASIARTSVAVSHSPSSSPEAHSVLASSFNSRASFSSGSSGSSK